jgi:hypothetical protein
MLAGLRRQRFSAGESMAQRRPNIIDTIAGIIPGYRGYADRDARRTADKLLRENVAAQLIRVQKDVDDVLLQRVDAGRLQGLDDLDRLKRELGACADAFRNAPAGGSGLMDDIVVTAADLDRVHEHDLQVQQAAGELADDVAKAATDRDSDAVLALRPRVVALKDAIARREDVLHQVFD